MKSLYADDTGYSVRLLGTPAEEAGGGKLRLIDAGAYKDVDPCLMVHPFPELSGSPKLLSSSSCAGMYLANNKVKVTFTGQPAHASAAPWESIIALDAVVAAYVNISFLRQQILPTQKIHGVVLNGGERPNVIPRSTTVEYYIRSETLKTLKPLTERVVKCFEAAAIATGCTVDFEWYVTVSVQSLGLFLITSCQGARIHGHENQHAHLRRLQLHHECDGLSLHL